MSTTSAHTPPSSNQTSNPTHTLAINAHGIPLIGRSCSSSQLTITITHPNGSTAYISSRASKYSGNAILSSPSRGDLVKSEYRWGPGRPPVLRVFGRPGGEHEVVKVSGKWTSRTQTFVLGRGRGVQFDWRYRRESVSSQAGSGGQMERKQGRKKCTVLVLEVPGISGKHVSRVARLVRGDGSRAVGTSSWSAGNGGMLEVDAVAAQASGVSEELIVASCIMMLKKEMDRRRESQVAVT